MGLEFEREFERDAGKLPFQTQELLASALELLAENPFSSRLHTKPLSGTLSGIFSFRIGRDYRALFRFVNTRVIMLMRVKHRRDVYR